ncbi:hypothetical protein P5673_009541 [Acropora cervicornis]|uniref:Uncharacterized protein n=1 Tax=Acropora cervicornis TaxID=6130 RepID=A0AAD9VA50_ACRCE|nr:hypothetical protein P5673_009541 [Acropora cervicornis]
MSSQQSELVKTVFSFASTAVRKYMNSFPFYCWRLPLTSSDVASKGYLLRSETAPALASEEDPRSHNNARRSRRLSGERERDERRIAEANTIAMVIVKKEALLKSEAVPALVPASKEDRKSTNNAWRSRRLSGERDERHSRHHLHHRHSSSSRPLRSTRKRRFRRGKVGHIKNECQNPTRERPEKRLIQYIFYGTTYFHRR